MKFIENETPKQKKERLEKIKNAKQIARDKETPRQREDRLNKMKLAREKEALEQRGKD